MEPIKFDDWLATFAGTQLGSDRFPEDSKYETESLTFKEFALNKYLALVVKLQPEFKEVVADNILSIIGNQPIKLNLGQPFPNLVKEEPIEMRRFKDHMESTLSECFGRADRVKLSWLLTGSNPFWRIWKSQVAKGYSAASKRLLNQMSRNGIHKLPATLRDLRNLGVITLELMLKMNTSEKKLNDLAVEKVSIKIVTSSVNEITLPFWQWAACCSQVLGRCGLWKNLTVSTGGNNLKLSEEDTKCEDTHTFAVCHMISNVCKIDCIPKSSGVDATKLAEGKILYDKIMSEKDSD